MSAKYFLKRSLYMSAFDWASDNLVESLNTIRHIASAMGNRSSSISLVRACVIYGAKRLHMRVRDCADPWGRKRRKKVRLSENICTGIDSSRRPSKVRSGADMHMPLCDARAAFWQNLKSGTHARTDRLRSCLLYTSPSPRDKRQ